MNQLVGRDKDGNVSVSLILEPGNLHRIKQGNPVDVRVEDLFPEGIPKKVRLLIFYSETPIATSRELEKQLYGRKTVKLDERTPQIEKQRPHCPECHSTIMPFNHRAAWRMAQRISNGNCVLRDVRLHAGHGSQ
jgi:hypothetical protein